MKHAFPSTLLPVLSQSELQELSKEVKEILVNYTPEKKVKKFTTADLWSIHKSKRNFGTRNFLRN